jgi:hypothetical protein
LQATADHILRENIPHSLKALPENCGKPKSLGHFRELCSRHHCRGTEQTNAHSVKRFIYYHNIRVRKPTRLSAGMNREEVKPVLANLTGDKGFMASKSQSVLFGQETGNSRQIIFLPNS